jgi:hypothetical protein
MRIKDRLPGSDAGVNPNIKALDSLIRFQELFAADTG